MIRQFALQREPCNSEFLQKKGPIVTMGNVLASLITSTAVLSNQRTLVRHVPGDLTCALVVHADLRYGFEE